MNEDEKKKIFDYLKVYKSFRKIETYCLLPTAFSSSVFLKFIELHFVMVARTNNFLQLDFKVINRILSSPSLSITSEVEVFQAGNAWLSYNFDERSQFAESLLLKVRFPLMSDAAVAYVLHRNSSFRKDKDSLALINGILASKETFFNDKSSMYYTNRYCEHDMFNILTFGGFHKEIGEVVSTYYEETGEVVSRITKVNISDNFNGCAVVSSLAEARHLSEAV